MKKDFSKIIYVVKEQMGKVEAVTVFEHFEDIPNGSKVGVYNLSDVKKMVVTSKLT